MGEPIVRLARFLLFVHFFKRSLFHYLPIQEALTHVFQFDGETYDLSLVSLEWFKVVVVDNLFLCCGNASILGELQLYYIYIMYGSNHQVNSSSGKHLFYLHTATDGIISSPQASCQCPYRGSEMLALTWCHWSCA